MKIKYFLLLLIFFSLISCEKQMVRIGRSAYKNYFKEILKDPESLKIYNEQVLEQDDVSVKFKVDIGAKNSYGGYVRETYYVKTLMGRVVEALSEEEYLLKAQNNKNENNYSKKNDNTLKVPPYFYNYRKKELPVMIDTSMIVGKQYIIKDSVLVATSPYDYDRFLKGVKNNDPERVSVLFELRNLYFLREGNEIKVLSNIEYEGNNLIGIKYYQHTLYMEPGFLY